MVSITLSLQVQNKIKMLLQKLKKKKRNEGRRGIGGRIKEWISESCNYEIHEICSLCVNKNEAGFISYNVKLEEQL